MSSPTRAGSNSPKDAYAVPYTAGDAGQDQQDTIPLPAAKTPVGPGAVTVVGLILAVLVVALGVVGVHEALVVAGTVKGASWVDAAIKPFDQLTPDVWLIPVGVALVVLGLWLVLTALRPRRRTAMALAARTGVFLRPRDVAKLARNAAQGVDGVTSAKVTANRRKVSVVARATARDGVGQEITQAVTTRLQALAKAPTVRVDVKADGGS